MCRFWSGGVCDGRWWVGRWMGWGCLGVVWLRCFVGGLVGLFLVKLCFFKRCCFGFKVRGEMVLLDE